MNNYIYEFKDLPSTDTPYNASTFQAMQLKLLDSVFPIGRGFIDFTNTDYSNYLGFTWERELVGLTPIGYNPDDEDFNTIGATMGEKAHTLTIDEMPSHYHTERTYSSNYNNGISIPVAKAYARGYAETTGDWAYNGSGTPINNCELSDMADTYSVGGGQSHNIIQPSKVVAYWKRIA